MGFTATTYKESDAVKNAAKALSNAKNTTGITNAKNAYNNYVSKNKVSAWTGGTYGQSLQDTVNKIANREKFSYDLNGDALYNQYKTNYINQGKQAMADTMGQAASLTGGYGNSYATTAGNQAYQSYLTQLNDIVPELYENAYNKYVQEGTDLQNLASLYNSLYGTEYGEYRDKVDDYNTESNRLYTVYQDALDQYNTNRDYYTDWYTTLKNMDLENYYNKNNLLLNIYSTNKSFNSSSSSSSGSSGSSNSSSNKNSDTATKTSSTKLTSTPTAKNQTYYTDDQAYSKAEELYDQYRWNKDSSYAANQVYLWAKDNYQHGKLTKEQYSSIISAFNVKGNSK